MDMHTIGKGSTTEIVSVRIVHPEAAHLIAHAHRIVMTLKGRKRYDIEGERIQTVDNIVSVELTQGEMAGLWGDPVYVEVTFAMPFGVVKKTRTLPAHVGEAVRKEAT